MKKRIIFSITFPFAIYLLGAFAHATFNIKEWGGIERGFVAFFMGLSIIFAQMVTDLSELNSNKD